jgi:hypothetical protein
MSLHNSSCTHRLVGVGQLKLWPMILLFDRVLSAIPVPSCAHNRGLSGRPVLRAPDIFLFLRVFGRHYH